MSFHFHKKPVIWVGSIALLTVALIIIFISLFKNNPLQKEQYKAEKKQLSEIFATLDTAYWRNKDKGLSLSNKAINVSKKINDSNAWAEALYNKARIIQKFEINDSSFSINNQALTIAEKFHNDTLIAKIKGNIGAYYYYKDNYYLAMLYYTEAENIAVKLHDDYLIAKAANGLGLVYTEMYDYKKAIEYYKESIHILGKLTDKAYTYDYCSVLISIGNYYMYNGEYTKAIFYQRSALEKADQLHDLEMINKIYGNLGAIEQYQGHSSSALKYFLKVLDYYNLENGHSKKYVTILHNIGAYYLLNKQYDKAEDFLNQSLSISQEMGFKSMEGGNIYALSEVKKKQKQWQKAYEYHTRWQEINDSLLSSEMKMKISDYQWEMKSQKKKYKEELLLKKYDIQKKRNLILIIAVVSIIVIALVVGRSLKKSVKFQKLQNTYLQEKMKTDEKINSLEKFKYQAEIELKNRELSTISFQLVTKNEILSNISKVVDKHYDTNTINSDVYNDLNKITKENLNIDKDWDKFKEIFEKVHHNFFLNMKQRCPALTENELRFCAFLRINLQNKEIAQMLSASNDAIKKTRYRIRKKLNLDNKTNLEDYVRNI
jgi:tetratricopeptide (TPR) repeat protein